MLPEVHEGFHTMAYPPRLRKLWSESADLSDARCDVMKSGRMTTMRCTIATINNCDLVFSSLCGAPPLNRRSLQ